MQTAPIARRVRRAKEVGAPQMFTHATQDPLGSPNTSENSLRRCGFEPAFVRLNCILLKK